MRIDPSRALGTYAAATTLALAWMVLGGAADGAARFQVLDVERINVREPDGTLRMTLAGAARMPRAIVEGREYPHPNRTEAGMIFFNDEGTENGGLVFDGRRVDGRPTNGGSLTFDRWRQDQTVQMTTEEEGSAVRAGFVVNDHPAGAMDIANAAAIVAMPEGPAKAAAIARGNFAFYQRAWLGRQRDGASQLVLRDGAGRARLRLSVAADGASGIEFLDAAGKVTRTVR